VLLLDPTHELQPAARARAPRLKELRGQRIALLDISKPRGNVFLDRLQDLLEQRGAEISRFRKPTFTKNAPPDLRQEISEHCHAVVEALAD
jgi:hypothetical protein